MVNNNSLSRYVKKPSAKTRSMAQKSGSWIANAFKSVGYSTFDVLQELLPSTIDAAKVTATTGKDIAESIRKVRTSDRALRQAIDRNYYVGLGREVFKNSLEDLKTGKFYNKERADQFFADMNDDMMDFGDFEDFDTGESGDDFSGSVESSDGETVAKMHRKKGGNNEVTSVVVNTNLGPDSAMYQATQYQTETMVNVGQAVVDFNKANSRAMLTMLGGMRNEINANLTSINENVSQITTVVGESLGKHSALAAKYFEDSISLQTQILEQLKLQAPNTQVNTRTFKDYQNVSDIFSSGGMLDPKAYAGLVQKQLDSYIDNNMFLSQLKFIAGEKDTLKMMAQNPLAFVPKAITKQLIPDTVKSILTEFDNQVKETSIAALNQISGLQRSDNPLLAALGKIFGVQNKITISSIDKGAYNKGATAWTGTDHQALVNVIPTLLRKIHSSVSGSEEIAFNYETGQFQKVRDMEKQFEKDKLQRETSGYSDYKSDFKEFLDKSIAASREDRQAMSEDFEKFISALVRDQYGGRTFRLNGRDGNEEGRDDIRDLLGKQSSDDTSVKAIRAFLSQMEGVNNSALTRFFGSALQEQRAHVDNVLREMQADPTKYNTMYMNTGLGEHNREGKGRRGGINTDAHLNYHENDLTKVRGVTGGLLNGVVDKYGHNQTHYLREILQTLNTGIYVVPVGSLGAEVGNSDKLDAINARVTSVTGTFKSDKDRAKGETPKPQTSNYGEEKKEKDLAAGKIDTDNDFTQDQINNLGKLYHQEQQTQTAPNKGIISKLLGMLPEDSGASRILTRVQNAQQKGTDKVTEVVKKMDNALFQIVFGNEKGHKGFYALFDKTLSTMKAGFTKFSLFIDEKVLKPLDEAIFGENGIVNKVKQTDAWQAFSKFMKESTKKAEKFFLGDKDGDGNRTGGLFSETANSLKDMGTHVKEGILGKKGPDGKPLPLEDDTSILGNLKRMFKNTTESIGKSLGIESNPNETFGTKLANGMDMIYHRIKERANEFSENIFGQTDDGPEFLKQFKEDMKGQGGFIGASAVVGGAGGLVLGGHMGLLGSLFLPGGPIGGAILGAGIGIASKSTGLKNALFGPEDGNGERTGGLITKEFQDFFKQNKTGITVGGLAGLAASFGVLPALFVPGGPIGGAIIGGALSMATKTDAFQKLMYGEGGTKDDPTGGISKKLKEAFGKNKDLKGVAVDVGIGAGVGLLGSFFLPGGPILGALLGSAASVGLASEKFKTWFFGEKDEKTNKREGGVFGKFSGFMKKEVFGPLSTTVKIAQTKILGFVKENMVLPFQYAMKPLVEEAKYVGGVIKQKITDVFDSVKEKIHTHITKPIGDFVKEHFLDPMKKMLSGLFSGLGKFVGNIIAAPFRIIGGAGKMAYDNQKARGAKAFEDEYVQKNGLLKSFGAKVWSGLAGAVGVETKYAKGRREAQFGDNGAWYDPNGDYYDRLADDQARVRAETDAKIAAIRNGTSIDTSAVAPIGIGRQSTTIPGSSDNNGLTRINTNTRNRNKKLSKKQRRLEMMSRAGIDPSATSVNTNVKGSNLTQDQLKEYLRNKFGRKGSPDTSGGSFEDAINSHVDAIDSQRQHGDRTKVSTTPTESRDTTRPIGSSNQSASKASEDKSGRKAKDSGTFLSRIQKDVSQIASSVYGQLNGVGSNVNKIYRTMLKLNKLKDEDIKGDNNKEYVGFFGRIRTALNRPLQAIGDLITAPFRKISDVFHGFVDKIKNIGNVFGKIGGAIKSGFGAIVKGIGEGAKAIGGVVVEVAKLPFEIMKTGLKAVQAILPALGEAAKGVVTLAVDGIKVAGSLVVNSVKTVGNTIAGAAKGFGQMLGGAMSGLGSLLSGFGLIGKDVLVGAWKGLKFVGKGALKVAGAAATAPFKILGGLFGGKGKGGLFGRKGPVHVIVDSGTLDTVKKVKKVVVGRDSILPDIDGGKGGFGIKPIPTVKPLPGGFGDNEKKPLHVIIDDVRKTAFEKIKDKLGSLVGKDKDPLRNLDRNVGDTAVDASMVGGGSADDAAGSDQSLADDDNRTSVATSIANLKASFAEAGQQMSDGFAAIKEKFNTRIASRQAQVDKGSRASMMERFAADQKAEEESSFRTQLLSTLKQNTQVATEHKSIFSSIFSKKGLITGALIALLPFLLKLFKNFDLIGLLKNLAEKLGQGFNEVGGASGVINNMEEKADQVTSVVTGKENNYAIDENGNLVYDENGNLVKQEEKTGRLKALFTPTKTRVDTKTGKWEQRNDWTQMSGATANFLGHKVGIPALRAGEKGLVAFNKGRNIASKVANKIYNSEAVTAAYTYADDAVKAAKGGVAKWIASGRDLNALKNKGLTSLAGEAGKSQKLAGKVVGLADNVAGTANKVAHSQIVETFIKKAGEALNFLTTKMIGVGEKFGLKLGETAFGKFLKNITGKVLQSGVLQKFADKISKFMTKISEKTAVSGSTAFIAEIGFAVYGAVEGAVNAAGLFEVPKDAVDAKMRAIAAVFKGLLGTTVGSVIDFINALVYEIIGTNFIKEFATHVYNLLSDEEDKKAMKAAQDDFTKGYHDYVEEEYEAYKKGAEEAGQKAMSLEDFKGSDLVTTRSEYNSKVNKSLFRRGVDAVKAIGSVPGAIKKGVTSVWTTVKGGPKALGKGLSTLGGNIASGVSNFGTGVVNKAKDLGSNIVGGAKNLGNRIANSKVVHDISDFGANAVSGAKNLGIGVVNKAKDLGSSFSEGAVNVFNKGKELFGKVGSGITDFAKQGADAGKGILSGWNSIADTFYNKENSFFDYFKADVNPLNEDNMFHGVVGAILNTSKVVMFPSLLLAGILKKLGKAVTTTATKIFTGAKTAFADFTSNVQGLGKLALSGDVQGLGQYELEMSEDNPISGFTSGMVGIARAIGYPIALISKGAHVVVDIIKNVIAGVKTAGTDYVTNFSNIRSLALSGDLEGLGNYEVQTSDDNPISGFTGGMVGVARVFSYPIALIAKGAYKVAEIVRGAISGVKTAGTDYVTNVSTIHSLALSGNLEGLGQYEIQTSKDNPISGFTSGLIGITRILNYPLGLAVAGGKKVAEIVRGAISGTKTAVSDYATNVSSIGSLALSGDLEGLGNYEIMTSEDNPISGFTGGLIGITRILSYPLGLVVAGGKKVVEGVKGAISAVVTTGQQIGAGSTELGQLALSGNVSAMHSYQGVDEEGNPVGGFANAVLGVEKFLLSPLAYTIDTGKKIAGFIKGAITKVVDYGSSAKSFISKLNEYTDPDKDMSGWANETMVSDESDFIGSALGSIIKGVMSLYVNLVRGVKGATKWIGDAVTSVKDTVTGAFDWVGDRINDAGTAVMNLGRGGSDGGRPIYGGFGNGPETLNGMPYYSQNDPRYKDKPYHLAGGQGGDTIGDAGCGPTAMAMVASKVTGKDYNPVTMTKMAEVGGYGTKVGTTPGYFRAAGNALGIPNAQQQPSANNLQQSLANGNSVILQGAKGAGGGSANSPYTSEGHYVTATGIDKNNNVLINDPRGKQYSGAYRMGDVMQDTTGMWSFATGGKGGTGVSILSTLIPSERTKSGFLSKVLRGGKSGNSFTAEDVIKIAKSQVGYEEKASASQLDDPHANRGSNNHTKYEKEVFGSSGNYWCASFVSWCFVQAANGDKNKARSVLGALSMSCNEIMNALKGAGRFDKTAKPGDAIFFSGSRHSGANHIGIVVDIQGNNVITVEGNTSSHEFNDNGGTVASHTYNINDGKILGFGHPKYDGSSNFQGITASGTTSSDSVSGDTSSSTTTASSGPSSFADLFTGFADAVTKPIYERFGISTDSSSTSVNTTSGDTTSGGTFTSMNGGGSMEANAAIIAKILKNNGFNNNQIGGILSNWNAESTIDATSVETIYDEKFQMGSKKQAANSDFNTFTTGTVFPKYAGRVNIHKDAYRAGDGKYYPGIGLGQWTGPRAKALIDYAKSNNKNWYDTDSQINFMLNADSFKGRLDTFKSTTAGYSPKEAAKYFENKWEGSTYKQAEHQATADSWAAKVPSLVGGAGGHNGGRPLYGGFGGDETIGDAGCGPTAMAMVASKVTGKDYNPITMARMAEDGGYATQVGTTPGYFSAAGNALGIPNAQVEPNASNLQQSLANGDSVILQGARGGFGNSPYTSEGHYVTATGVDKDKVYINDPRGKEYSGAYRLKDVMNDTTGMWSFGGMGGFGKNPARTKLLKGGKGQSADYEKWISICRAVKQAIAAQHPGYSQSRYITITVGGRSMKARTDCSGYVQTCLKFFGVMPEGTNITSGNVTNAGDSVMKATGFTPMSWPGWENLKEGDIMGTSGHTEIFAYNKDGAHYVYNCGSDSSTNSATPTRTGHSAYTTIWRCGGAGSGAVSSFGVGDGQTADGTTVSGTVDSGSSSGGASNFGDVLTGFADAAMKPIYEAFGISTNTGDSGGTAVDGSGTSTGDAGAFSAANLSGGDTAQKVWNYFTGAGYSKQATAGILGNMEQESGVNPASIQGNGKGPAAGIVQWENYNTKSSRWKQLSDYAASKGKDWTDLGSQLEFIDKELKGLGSFWSYAPNMSKAGTTPTSYDQWKQSTSVDTATRQFEGAFERAGTPAMERRLSAANAYYNKFSGGGNGGNDGGRPISRIDTSRQQNAYVKPIAGRGGYGNVSQVPYSVSGSLTPTQQSAFTRDRINGSIGSNDMSQLLKVAVDYLSQIVDNTGETNTELDALNKKDFGRIVSQTNNTTNMVDNSAKSYNSGSEPKNVADRSEYAMAKRVAAGILD